MVRYVKRLTVSVLTLLLSSNAYTIGDGNMDSGGGDMSQDTSQENKWSVGDEGIRISIIRSSDQAVISKSIDYTNKSPDIQLHSGTVSKVTYRNGTRLAADTTPYVYVRPAIKLPKVVISAGGHSSIEEIKRYFCSEYMIQLVSQDTGILFETIINGDYKILLEPVAYVTHNGTHMAMTVTEAAYYLRMGTNIQDILPNASFKNVSFSMFSETPGLGYPAWSGSRDQLVTED